MIYLHFLSRADIYRHVLITDIDYAYTRDMTARRACAHKEERDMMRVLV